MRNHRRFMKSQPRRRAPLHLIPLEDRVLPGDSWLGALVAHGFLPQHTRLPREQNLPGDQPALTRTEASSTPARATLAALEPSQPAADAARHISSARDLSALPAVLLSLDLGDDPLQLLSVFGSSSRTQPALPMAPESVERLNLAGSTTGGGAQLVTPQGGVITTPPAVAPVGDPYQWVFGPGVSGPGPGEDTPNPPVITEPSRDGHIVSPADVHMETGPFSDPRPGATHAATNWELVVTADPPERIWAFRGTSGGDLIHVHLGDGQFEGSHTGFDSLLPETDYALRVQFVNNFGEESAWSTRTFRTASIIPGDPDARWAVRQPGYQVEVVARDFRLPVNVAFVPNPGPNPEDPLYYVTELYGIIKVVSNDGTVGDYATNLLNFNPTGQFPGSGEQGLTGITVDPLTGDVYASMVYSLRPFDDTSPHYGKVMRFTSTDGGLTAATRQDIMLAFGAGEEQGQSHQISNVTIGADHKLYVHNGEGFDASRAGRFDRYGGKILRMNLDGTPAPDNPFYQSTARIPVNYIWVMGLRNPFGGAWRASTGEHYEVENGPGANDRIARVQAGQTLGWNGDDRTMTFGALYNWQRPTAPVNITFIEPETFNGSGFPAEKFGHAFVSESGPTYGGGPQQYGKRITEFIIDEQGRNVQGPMPLIEYVGTGRASATALASGPDGLYFADLYRDDGVGGPTARGANVYRIKYVGKADFTQDVNADATAPLTVQFVDQSDPAPKQWFWDFGDQGHSEDQNPKHEYAKPGIYSVTLTTIDADGAVRTKTRQALIGAGEVGLRGDFFNFADPYDFNRGDFGSIRFNGTGPHETRIDPTVNYAYSFQNPPHPNIRPTNLYASWTGVVHSRSAGTYTFSTTARDGARLWVNNELIVNNWTTHGGQTTTNGTITLDEDSYYFIRFDMFHLGGAPSVQLRWTPPGEGQQIIPAENLAPLMSTPDITPPSSLRLGAVTDDFVELMWNNNADNADEVLVERALEGEPFVPIVSLPPTQRAYFDAPEEGGVYRYRIRAVNKVASSVSNVSSPVAFRVPAAPVNLTVTEATVTRVTVAWTAASTNHTGFRVERSVNGGAFAQIGQTAANVFNFADTNVPGGNTYTYRIRAFNANGAGFPSVTTQVSFLAGYTAHDIGGVGQPGGHAFNAVNGTHTIVASGNDIWDGADQFHFVYRQITGDGEIVARVRSLVRADFWTKAGVMIRENLTTGSRNAAMLTTPQPDHNEATFQRRLTPNAASASNGGGTNSAPVPYWVRLVRQGNNFTGYRSVNGSTWVQLGPTVAIAMPATVYWGLAVTSHNNAAITTAEIDNVSIGPVAPSNLRTTSVTQTDVNLAWNDNSTNEGSFRVERSVDGTNFMLVSVVPANTTTYTDRPAQAGTYFYRILAVGGNGRSGSSNVITVAFRIPLAPSNTRITNATQNSATLAWNDNSTNETGFRIESSVDGTNWSVVTTTAANVTSYTNTGLTSNTYRYRVAAVNADGPSLPSNVAIAAVGVIDYSSGFLPPGRINLVTNGVAGYLGNSVRLTPAVASGSGNIFTLGRTNITRFTASFEIQIRPGSDPMADGMTFCIQSGSPTVLANGGNGLGYGPDNPGGARGIRNSVALKFDIYNLAGEGDNSTGLFSDGRSPSVPEGGSGDVINRIDAAVLDLKSHNPLRVDMTYNGTVLQVTIRDTVTTRSVTHNYTVNIATLVGGPTAFVGFTAGTGALTALQDVHNFRFATTV